MAKRQIYVSTGSGNGSSLGQCKANYWANKLLWKIQNSFQENDFEKIILRNFGHHQSCPGAIVQGRSSRGYTNKLMLYILLSCVENRMLCYKDSHTCISLSRFDIICSSHVESIRTCDLHDYKGLGMGHNSIINHVYLFVI